MEGTEYPIQVVPRTSAMEAKWRDVLAIKAELDPFSQI